MRGGNRGFGAVLSDMAPATSGQRDVDAERSLRLAMAAVDIALGREEDKAGGVGGDGPRCALPASSLCTAHTFRIWRKYGSLIVVSPPHPLVGV